MANGDERKDWLGRGWAFPVRIDRTTGGIALSEYEVDVRESIRILLDCAPGERVMRPDFGCGIHEMVFASIDTATRTRIEHLVADALKRYEARVDVLSVQVDALEAVDGLLRIELEYRVRRTNRVGNLVYPFYFREGGVTDAGAHS